MISRTRRCVPPVAAVAAALLPLLCSCATIPLPGTPGESLVVFVTDIPRDSWGGGKKSLAGGGLTVEEVTTKRRYTASFGGGNQYAALALPPGSYSMTTLTLNVMSTEGSGGTWQDTGFLGGAVFVVAPNTVQICGRGVSVMVLSNGYRISTMPTTSASYDSRKASILPSLRNSRRWSAWEEYQLVNFPAEQSAAPR